MPQHCIRIKTLPARAQSLRCPPCPPTQRRPKRALVCVGSSKNGDPSDNSHDHNNQQADRDIKAAHSEVTLKRRRVGGPALSVSSSTTGPEGKGFAPVSRPGPVKDSSGRSLELKDHITVTVLLAVWYAANVAYNILNKQVLNADWLGFSAKCKRYRNVDEVEHLHGLTLQVFPFATTCTLVHLTTASLVMLAVWTLGLHRLPSLGRRMLNKVAPLAGFHLLGFWATNVALAAVNVSLVHTTMTLEPFFSVLLSVAFLKFAPSLSALVALLPIVAGVAVACSADSSFTWFGFAAALAANLAFQFRNMYSKKYMVENSMDSFEAGGNYTGLDEVNLFACITLASTMLMVPIVLFVDGTSLIARLESGVGQFSAPWFGKTALAGVCRAVDVLASYALLARVNPFTHSLSNCARRIGVIGASLILFNIPTSTQSLAGIGLAAAGTLAYSFSNRADGMSQLDQTAFLQSGSGGSVSVEKLMMYVAPDKLKNALDEFGWTYHSPTASRKDGGDMPPQEETYNL